MKGSMMEFHPISKVWPLMSDEQLDELIEDIRSQGQLQPIWLYEGKILDGRNRWTACIRAGVKPVTKNYEGDSPTAFAVALNDHRRHMNKAALAAVGVELLPFFSADAKRRQKAGGGDKKSAAAKSVSQKVDEPIDGNNGKATADAAKSVGVNRQYIQDAKKVKEECPEIFEKLKAGKISMQDAKREVAKKPTDDWRDDERQRQKKVEKGRTVVANAERDKNLIAWGESQGIAVRVDRGTRYGNPFLLDDDGSREVVCESYAKAYLPLKPSITNRLSELRGKILVCHCYPLRCHADTLAELADDQ